MYIDKCQQQLMKNRGRNTVIKRKIGIQLFVYLLKLYQYYVNKRFSIASCKGPIWGSCRGD